MTDPLQNLLGSLIACQSHTARETAKEMNIYIKEIAFIKVRGDI